MSTTTPKRQPTSLLRRLIGAVGVGGLATLVDLLLLVLLVEGLRLSPSAANVPALLGGALVQFVGCRSIVFRETQRGWVSSLGAFALVEVGTLALNAIIFGVLVAVVPPPYALLRLVSTFVVFAGFSFPAWHWVFGPRRSAR